MNNNVSVSPWRDPWVWLGAVLVGLSLVAAVGGSLLLIPAADVPSDHIVLMTVIPAPTATPSPPATPTPPAVTATPIAPPLPVEGTVAVGVYVQIRGTGGDGLRLRAQPGLEAPILGLAKEDEVLQVAEGPQEADGYTWWRLEAPNGTRGGWAVANYLSVLPVTTVPTPTP